MCFHSCVWLGYTNDPTYMLSTILHHSGPVVVRLLCCVHFLRTFAAGHSYLYYNLYVGRPTHRYAALKACYAVRAAFYGPIYWG